jgi:hypothetical protein
MTVDGSMRPDTVTFPCSASMLLWYTPADQPSTFHFSYCTLLNKRLGEKEAFFLKKYKKNKACSKAEQTLASSEHNCTTEQKRKQKK